MDTMFTCTVKWILSAIDKNVQATAQFQKEITEALSDSSRQGTDDSSNTSFITLVNTYLLCFFSGFLSFFIAIQSFSF
eukprot:m.405870 g.405870  ORF g.405870 m.405870 type:complete len:78 (-) comp16795_c3_seq38:130-363(-)